MNCEDDDETEGRELFFLGIGAPAKPRVSRLTVPRNILDRSGSESKQDERWSVVLGGRDALFSRNYLLLVSENGCGISILKLPESPDTAHIASWQVFYSSSFTFVNPSFDFRPFKALNCI